jgi:hydrogenase nickel incorporation protein HypA/HybF
MHDWHLANEILKTVLDYAIKNGLKNVSKVEIELGSIIEHDEIIKPENLTYHFKLLTEKTIAKNAELKIKKITRLPARQEGDEWKLISIED